jgi:glycosyltransferase involved in cell wall biosynthesis
VRVLVVDPSLYTLPYDRAFCRALAAAGAEVTLVGRPLRAGEHLAAEGFAFVPLFYRVGERAGRLQRLVKGAEHGLGLLALARLVHRLRPRIVHLQWLVLPLLDRLLLARIGREAGLVVTVHNSASYHGSASRLRVRGERAALRRFDAWVAHTERTRAHLAGLGVPAARVRLLPHPPLDLAPPGTVAPPPAAPGMRTLLLFGALKPYKGVDVLIRAALLLARTRRDFRVALVGRPAMDLAPLLAEISAAGLADRLVLDLRFLPEPDLGAWLRAADLALFPYHDIDGSGALVAAAQAGLPIVASAVGGFTEPPVRDHVLLVPPGDPAALAAALDRLLGDPAALARLATQSRGLAAALPSWDRFAAACLELYATL